MKKLKQFFISTLIGGLTVLLPIGILIFIFDFIFDFIIDFVSPISNALQLKADMGTTLSNLTALIIIFGICFATGFFIRTRFGGFLHNIAELYLNKIPGYSTIKETIEQFTNSNMKDSFSKVALADVYNTGSLSTVFLVEQTDDLCTVFIPTGPNPTSGNIFHVPQHRVFVIDVKIDEAMRSIIGVGLGSSKLIESYKQNFIENKED